jgi:hypothetical protein
MTLLLSDSFHYVRRRGEDITRRSARWVPKNLEPAGTTTCANTARIRAALLRRWILDFVEAGAAFEAERAYELLRRQDGGISIVAESDETCRGGVERMVDRLRVLVLAGHPTPLNRGAMLKPHAPRNAPTASLTP